jgi:biotin transport system substrate-specific component
MGEAKTVNKQKMKTLDMAYIALMVVLMAVCSWISVPAEVPFTLQTFGVFCAVGLLGGKRGSIAVLVYIIMGAVGLPVFSGFTGGLGHLLGATGGYIVGFLFSALAYWLVTRLLGTKLWVMAAAMVLSLAVCYAFGTAWFMVVYANNNGAIALATILVKCVIPYIIPDLLKIALALLLTKTLGKHVKIQ